MIRKNNKKFLYESIMRDIARTVKNELINKDILESKGQERERRLYNRPYDPNNDVLLKNKDKREKQLDLKRMYNIDILEFTKKVKNIISQLNLPVPEADKMESYFTEGMYKTLDHIEIISYNNSVQQKIESIYNRDYSFVNTISIIQSLKKQISGHMCFTMVFYYDDKNAPRLSPDSFKSFLNGFKQYLQRVGFKNYYINIDLSAMCWVGIKIKKSDSVETMLNNFLVLLQFYVRFLNENFEKYFYDDLYDDETDEYIYQFKK